jgi:TctA family transporter
MLGALIMVGIEPGPGFLKEHLDLAYTLTGTLIFANIVAAVITYLCARQIAKVTEVPGHILAPIILVLITIGAFSTRHQFLDIVMMLVLGVLGYAMATYGFNRPALLLGFVLGHLAEVSFFVSLGAYGPLFFLRPISLIIIALIILGVGFTPIKRLFTRLIKRQKA